MPLVIKHKYRDLQQSQIEELGDSAFTMRPAKRLKALEEEELATLTKSRLLEYRKKALSLENSLAESDYHDQEIEDWDPEYIYFKDAPRWQKIYSIIVRYLD